MTSPSNPLANKMPAVNTSVKQLTIDEVKDAMPTGMRSAVSPQLVQTLNTISSDPIEAENIKENFISYSAVLREGKFKIDDYISAVKYVSYKIMGHTNQEAYAKTFPQRYQSLLAAGKSSKDISAYVSGYNSGKLVNLIYEQTIIPTYVLNQSILQKAINVQAELMVTAQSEKVRTDAANSLLNHLKKPENQKFQINMDVVENSGMKEMREALEKLVKMQKEAIDNGSMKTIDVAASKLIENDNG